MNSKWSRTVVLCALLIVSSPVHGVSYGVQVGDTFSIRLEQYYEQGNDYRMEYQLELKDDDAQLNITAGDTMQFEISQVPDANSSDPSSEFQAVISELPTSTEDTTSSSTSITTVVNQPYFKHWIFVFVVFPLDMLQQEGVFDDFNSDDPLGVNETFEFEQVDTDTPRGFRSYFFEHHADGNHTMRLAMIYAKDTGILQYYLRETIQNGISGNLTYYEHEVEELVNTEYDTGTDSWTETGSADTTHAVTSGTTSGTDTGQNLSSSATVGSNLWMGLLPVVVYLYRKMATRYHK